MSQVIRKLPDLSIISSALDYQVKADGTTDNGAAIAAMCTALGASATAYEVQFPRGDYLVATNTTVPTGATLRFAPGARLLIPDGVTLTLNNVDIAAGRAQIFKCTGTGKVIGLVRNPYILPEWWGALADGLHPNNGADFSDRAAAAARNSGPLQAALNLAYYQYAINGNTATVQLTDGYYVYDKTLSIPLSVNVVGQGIGSALFFYSATGNAVESINTNNSLLADFFIAPIAGPTWNVSTGYGLYMKGVSTPCVRNVWSSGFGGGATTGGTFYFESVIEGRISGLVSDNSAGPAFTIRGVGQKTVFHGCLTANNVGACFDIQNCYDYAFVGCIGKHGSGGTNAFYLNGCENINLIGCGGHALQREGIVMTATALNCTLIDFFVNDASMASAGTYSAMNISGTRNKLIAPKVTSNSAQYSYGIIFGGGATDCTLTNENVTAGTVGGILDAQPIGGNKYHIRKVTTANATPLTIWTKNLNNNAGAVIKATVIGKQREAAGAGNIAYTELYAVVKTNATSTSIASGPTKTVTFTSAAGVSVDLVLTTATGNGGVVSLQVTGLASAYSVDWEAWVEVLSVTG